MTTVSESRELDRGTIIKKLQGEQGERTGIPALGKSAARRNCCINQGLSFEKV